MIKSKQKQNSKQQQQNFLQLLKGKFSQKIVNSLFWIIYCLKFDKNQKEIISKSRKIVSRNYSDIFISPKYKLNNEIINKMCCCFAYIIHFAFYTYFPQNRPTFSFRFILDCYHITFFEINGVFLSDYYVRILLENAFTEKFMSYEFTKNNQKSKLESNQKDKRPVFLLTQLKKPNLDLVQGAHNLWDILEQKFQTESKDIKIEYQNLAQTTRNKEQKEKNYFQNEQSNLYTPIGGKSIRPFKFDYNINQISPTISKLIHNKTMTIPVKKPKVITTV